MYEPFTVLSLPVPNANAVQLPILLFSVPLIYEKKLKETNRVSDIPILL